MAELTLTKTNLRSGVWEGIVESSVGATPSLSVTWRDRDVPGIELLDEDGGRWRLRVPIPQEAIEDGVQTFLVIETKTSEVVGHFALYSGAALADDIRAEVELLRAELDMLKRAFRRHCAETEAS